MTSLADKVRALASGEITREALTELVESYARPTQAASDARRVLRELGFDEVRVFTLLPKAIRKNAAGAKTSASAPTTPVERGLFDSAKAFAIYEPIREHVAEGVATPDEVQSVSRGLLDGVSLNYGMNRLAQMRKQLMADGATQEMLNASYVPEHTAARNAVGTERNDELAAAPMELPRRWTSAGALTRRLRTGDMDVTKLADLVVALAARTSELETLVITAGRQPTVSGMLKHGANTGAVPFMHAVPVATIVRALEQYRVLPDAERKKLRDGLRAYVAAMPRWSDLITNQPRALRAFGATLIARQSGATTPSAAMTAMQGALRHVVSRPAVLSYANVV